MTAWATIPWASRPSIPMPPAPAVPVLSPDVFDYRFGGALVWIADIEAAVDGGTLPTGANPWASRPWASRPPAMAPAGGIDTIRVSDMGWRGPAPYPPLLIAGPDIDRRVALAPGASDTYAWGSLRIAAPGIVPNTSLEGRDTAMRRVRLRVGVQGWDMTRGIVTDPNPAGLVDAFLGMGLTWQPQDTGAEVPLRDPTAWLDAPIGIRKFLGTGGAEGPSDLTGKPWPLVRGGSSGAPVRSCPVILVNAASRIYRWTDTGTLAAVYEDGKAVYTNDGAVADVFATAPAAGHYNFDATGQFRLGSDPAGTITVDGYGAVQAAATVLRNLLMDTALLPAGLLDEGSVLGTAAVAPYQGGWAWTGAETARDAIKPLLAALNARLISSRSGGLRLWPLRVLPAGARPVTVLDPATAEAVVPVALGAPLSPPAAVWSVGYGRTNVTTTAPNSTVTAAERERLAQPYRTAVWTDATNLTRYAQASRPDLVETALLAQADAQSLAAAIGALWGVPRRLWQVTVPTGAAVLREIGDVVTLRWPVDGLRSGALGQVVGCSIRAGQPTASLLILV